MQSRDSGDVNIVYCRAGGDSRVCAMAGIWRGGVSAGGDGAVRAADSGYLSEDYEPDLVDPEIPVAPDCQNSKMTKETSDALTKMYKAAQKEGLELVVNSAYRSYQTQVDTMAESISFPLFP